MALRPLMEAIRTRPGTYVGDTGELGLGHFFFSLSRAPARRMGPLGGSWPFRADGISEVLVPALIEQLAADQDETKALVAWLTRR
jgi:hypothetical protein